MIGYKYEQIQPWPSLRSQFGGGAKSTINNQGCRVLSGNLLTVVTLCFDSCPYHTVLYLAFYLASIPLWHRADIWCVLNLRAENRQTQRQMISEKATCLGHISCGRQLPRGCHNLSCKEGKTAWGVVCMCTKRHY